MAYSDQYDAASELFDTEPIHLSSHGHDDLDVDCLDISLHDSARIFFADSQASDDFLEGMLADSETSADLDRIFLEESNRMMGSAPLEYDSMCFDSIRVQENEVHQSSYNNDSIGSRSSQPAPSMQEPIQVSDVNFDPSPYNHQQQQRRSSCNDMDMLVETPSYNAAPSNYNSQPSYRPRRQRRVTVDSSMAPSFSHPQSRVAMEDTSMAPSNYNSLPKSRPQRRVTVDSCMALNFSHPQSRVTMEDTSISPTPSMSNPRLQRRVTLDSAMAPSLSQLIGRNSGSGVHQEGSAKNLQYHEAIQKLAQSMKRTELSRRQLMMLRTPSGAQASPQHHQPQQMVVTSAQQQLQQRVAGASPFVKTRSLSDEALSSIDGRSSIVADFFSGSRGTLTNGLEHSRRQLKMYVDQVGNS